MSWLEKLGLGKKKAEETWIECPKCHQNNFHAELEKNLRVCPKCEYHHRINAWERIRYLVNSGSFIEHDQRLVSTDPLKFKDKKKYKDRISSSLKKVSTSDAIITGTGTIGKHRVEICSFQFDFMGGSMGSVVGEKITRGIERAIHSRNPLLIVSCSGGARMQEGIFSLMQMAKTSSVLQQLADHRVPYISILTDPTTGGVSASFAMLGDIILAEPGALIGFAGPRVIEQTTKEKLPPGFQTAEFLLKHGLIDNVVDRRQLRPTLDKLLTLLKGNAARFNPTPQVR